MRYTYLLIDFATVLVPFIFSFHPKIAFYKNWNSLLPAILIAGTVFVLWDSYFTHLGLWGFNPDYITGMKVGNMPVEELLFFFCVPYSCIFTFECLAKLISDGFLKKSIAVINTGLLLVFVAVGLYWHARLYTLFTFTVLPGLIGLAYYILKINWLPKFYLIYALLLVPFLIVNGLLTGTGLNAPVVWYNERAFMGIRILTIPIEDVFYGMALILMNLLIYLNLKQRRHVNRILS